MRVCVLRIRYGHAHMSGEAGCGEGRAALSGAQCRAGTRLLCQLPEVRKEAGPARQRRQLDVVQRAGLAGPGLGVAGGKRAAGKEERSAKRGTVAKIH